MAVDPVGWGSTTPDVGAHSVPQDTAQSIIAVAEAGYTFLRWEASNDKASIADTSSAQTTVTLSGDATVTAKYTSTALQAVLTMAVTPDNSGTTDPTVGTHTVQKNEATTIKATAASGYKFTKWSASGDATIADSTSSTTTVTLTGNATVTANFESTTATLTMAVTPAAGGSTDPAVGTHSVTKSTSTTITATAASGYKFSTWTVTGDGTIANSSASSTTVTLTGDATVTATFLPEASTASLTMAVSPADKGTTTPTVGSHNISKDTAQAISATAGSGYKFSAWTVSGSATVADTSAASTMVTLTGDATVTATFVVETATATFQIAYSPPGGGSVTPTLPTTVTINTPYEITATPNEGFRFVEWHDSTFVTFGDRFSASTTVSITQDTQVICTFESTTATLTMAYSPPGAGSLTPNVPTTVTLNTPYAITATANEGYRFVEWAESTFATFGDRFASSTTVSISRDTQVIATFVLESSAASLTMAVYPENAGSTTPNTGRSNLTKGESQKIIATAADGYKFVGWSGSANAVIEDSTASTTTLTLAGDATVTALFAANGSETTGTITVDRLNVSSKGEEKDSVTLGVSLPEGFSFDPAFDSLTIMIGQWQLAIEQGSTWTDKGKLVYSGTVDNGKARILIDTAKKQILQMRTTNTTVGDKVSTSGGLDVYVIVGDDFYMGSCTPEERSDWNSTADSENESGFVMTAKKLKGKYTNVTDETKRQYTFTISGDGFEDPTGGFSSDIIPIISLDQVEWDFTNATVKAGKSNFKYTLKEANLTLNFKLDTKKGKWFFLVKSKGSDDASNISKSGSIRLAIKLKNTATSEEWESVNTIDTDVKSTIKFKKSK
jgi:hypothetical protein